MVKLGFIGYGEAAFCITSGLTECGVTGIVAFDAMQDDSERGKLVHKRSEIAGVTLLPSAVDVVAASDVVIVSVQSSYALDVCRGVCGVLRAGQIYADVSASSPSVKKDIWALLKNTDVLFVDAAMMGLLPVKRHEVPISASGNGARAFRDAMAPMGMKISVISDRPGDASAIKLIRSIYMKGYDALLFEMLRAAEAYDVFDEIIANCAESLDGVSFATLIKWMFPGLGIHAARRSAEMKGTLGMLEEYGIDSSLTAAIKNQLDLITRLDLSGVYKDGWPQSSDWREVFHYINNLPRGK